MRQLPRSVRTSDRRVPCMCRSAAPSFSKRPLLNKDTGFDDGERDVFGLPRAASATHFGHRRAGSLELGAHPPQRAMTSSATSAWPRCRIATDALLSSDHREPRRVHADRGIRPRWSVRASRSATSCGGRAVSGSRRRTSIAFRRCCATLEPTLLAPHPLRRRSPDRGHGQRADPGPRRPGRSGMGIPVGKLSLYTAGAGIYPAPPCRLAGRRTDNEALLADPAYIGYRHPRSAARVRRLHRGLRLGDHGCLPAGRAAVGRLQAAQRHP